MLAERHVMRQAWAGKFDRRMMGQLAARRDDVVGHVRRPGRIVKEQQLAAHRIDLGMRGHGTLELAAETLDADGLQRARIELVRQPALIPERERVAVVKYEVGVGGVLKPSVGARAVWNVGIGTIHQARPYRALRNLLGGESFGANPAVAVGGLAVLKLDAVHHAVAVEPMVAAARLKDRIGSVAQVRAVEIFGKLADDGQIVGGNLSRDRRVDSLEERILAGIDLNWNFALDLHRLMAPPRLKFADILPVRETTTRDTRATKRARPFDGARSAIKAARRLAMASSANACSTQINSRWGKSHGCFENSARPQPARRH